MESHSSSVLKADYVLYKKDLYKSENIIPQLDCYTREECTFLYLRCVRINIIYRIFRIAKFIMLKSYFNAYLKVSSMPILNC